MGTATRRLAATILAAFALSSIVALQSPAHAHSYTESSTVSITYSDGAFRGRVSSSRSFCESGRRVDVYKVREGAPDQLVGSDLTDAQGRWVVPRAGARGLFYAVAVGKTNTIYNHFHRCTQAESDTIRVRGGRVVAVLGAFETRGRDADKGGPEGVGAAQRGATGVAGGEAGGESEGVPYTGANLIPLAVAGITLTGAGFLLARRRRRSRAAT